MFLICWNHLEHTHVHIITGMFQLHYWYLTLAISDPQKTQLTKVGGFSYIYRFPLDPKTMKNEGFTPQNMDYNP